MTTGSGHALDLDSAARGNGLLSVSRGGLTLRAVYGVRHKRVPTGAFGAVFNDERARALDTQGYLDLGYTRGWSNGTEVTARASSPTTTSIRRLQHLRNREPRAGGTTGPDPEPRPGARQLVGRRSACLAPVCLQRHRLTVGAELRHDASLVQQSYDVDPREDFFDDRRGLSMRVVLRRGRMAPLPRRLALRRASATTPPRCSAARPSLAWP